MLKEVECERVRIGREIERGSREEGRISERGLWRRVGYGGEREDGLIGGN